MKTKKYIYATAANGMEVRIPADRYPQWKKAQDAQRQGKGQLDPQIAERLRSLMENE